MVGGGEFRQVLGGDAFEDFIVGEQGFHAALGVLGVGFEGGDESLDVIDIHGARSSSTFFTIPFSRIAGCSECAPVSTLCFSIRFLA